MLSQHGSAALGRALVRVPGPVEDDERTLQILYGYLERTRPTADEIRTAVQEYYLIDRVDMTSISRVRYLTVARWMYAYLAYRYTRLSMPQIAQRIGYADHSSVSYGIKHIQQLMLTHNGVMDDLDLLRLRIAELVLVRRTGMGTC